MELDISKYSGTMLERIQSSLTVMRQTSSSQTKWVEHRRQQIMKLMIKKQFVRLSYLHEYWENIGGCSSRFNDTILLDEKRGFPCMILNFGATRSNASCISGKYVCLTDSQAICLPIFLSTILQFIRAYENNTISLLDDISRMFKFGIGSADDLNERFCVSMLKTMFMACFGPSSVTNKLRMGYLADKRRNLMEAALLSNNREFKDKVV